MTSADALHRAGATMNNEIELKLAVAPEHVERLKRHPILRALKQRRSSTTRLVSIYYDTPAFELMGKAVALRVRKIGKQHIQSIKREAASGKSRVVRQEWEKPIEGENPDLSQFDDRELKRLIGPHKHRGALKPVFVTEVTRQIWPLRVGASEIECALDIGEIKTNGRSEPVCEVELELKSGAPARLFELARQLNKSVPMRLEPASKSARGYCLATGVTPGPKKSETVHLEPGMTVRGAFAAIARTCIVHILANVDCAHEGKEPEGVHQLRVGIRRLRAAFSVFQNAIPEADRMALGGELRWLQQELGPAREWDVFLNDTIHVIAKHFGGSKGLEQLRQVAEAERRVAYERSRAVLGSKRYTDILLRLEAWLDGKHGRTNGAKTENGAKILEEHVLDQEISGFSTEILNTCHARASKLGDRLKKLDEGQLHKLRIRVKKLRYATEFFRDLYTDKAAKRYISALKDLQEVLGDAHDAMVAVDLITRLEGEAKVNGLPEVERTVGRLQGWCAAQIKDDRKRLERLWRGFTRLKPFWKSA